MTSSAFARPVLGDLRARANTDLMQLARDLAADRRLIDADIARVAGELARRSDRSLGYEGLAVAEGDRTAEKLVSRLTGVSVGEARSMVTAGSLGETGFLNSVADGIASGELSVGAAAAIRDGLGEPNADVDAAALDLAARKLAEDATSMSPGEAARAARRARDGLDIEGVADRQTAARAKRYLRFREHSDGSAEVHGHLDPESWSLTKDALDRVTMPRRGGPRFVTSVLETSREEAAQADSRTLDQLNLDAFLQFIVMAAGVDDGTVFGVKGPAVRLHVRSTDPRVGYLEGNPAPVSTQTVHRFVCAGGAVPILFDTHGNAVNVGRKIRPFTSTQRIAIAARDGGCMAPGCDRPPSWTEVHHCREWSKGGTTDLINGISLCRHHHMWVHNTNRRIEYRDHAFWLHAPDGSPPVRLSSKHPLHRRDQQREHALAI